MALDVRRAQRPEVVLAVLRWQPGPRSGVARRW
jgi:hypothetical protein